MMWRPENWQEIKTGNKIDESNPDYMVGWDDGADAMLEALRQKGDKLKARPFECIGFIYPNLHCSPNVNGIAVFIPDE